MKKTTRVHEEIEHNVGAHAELQPQPETGPDGQAAPDSEPPCGLAYDPDWIKRSFSNAKPLDDFAVRRAVWTLLESESDRLKLNTDERRFLRHMVGSTLIRVCRGARAGELYVPMGCVFISNNFPAAYWRRLREGGLIRASGYARSIRLSRCFRLSEGLLKRVLETNRAASGGDFDEKAVLVMTGADTVRKSRNKVKDSSNHYEPRLWRDAVNLINRTGRVVNATAMWAVVDSLWREADELARAAETGDERDREIAEAARCRAAQDELCYETVYRNSKTLGGGLRLYSPSYTKTKTGRASERGGGLQTCTKRMKQASVEGLARVFNFDIRSSQPAILAQLIERALGSEHAAVWYRYAEHRDAKREHASRAGLNVEVWKKLFMATIFGARVEVEFKPLEPGKTFKLAILKAIYEAAGHDLDSARSMLEGFKREVAPYRTSLRRWHRYLIKTHIHLPGVASRRRSDHYITNAVGVKLNLSETPRRQWVRTVAAFFLQGAEAALVHNLTLLSTQFGFKVMANEHDGLLVELPEGMEEIPREAIRLAERTVDLKGVVFEQKEFYELPFESDDSWLEELGDAA